MWNINLCGTIMSQSTSKKKKGREAGTRNERKTTARNCWDLGCMRH